MTLLIAMRSHAAQHRKINVVLFVNVNHSVLMGTGGNSWAPLELH